MNKLVDTRDNNEIMRADDIRRMLHIGRNTLYNWVEQGLIPYKKVGHILLFSRKAINIWLESKNEGDPDEGIHREKR